MRKFDETVLDNQNWKDITIEEANQIKKEQETAMAEELEQINNEQITE